jgi:hypothetical protein
MEEGIEANANANRLKKLPKVSEWVVNNQLTDRKKGGQCVGWGTVNLLMCDREGALCVIVHITVQ